MLACGAGVQTVADAVGTPVFPGLESLFLGTVIRNGVYEERCQTCGDTAGAGGTNSALTAVSTCPATSCRACSASIGEVLSAVDEKLQEGENPS